MQTPLMRSKSSSTHLRESLSEIEEMHVLFSGRVQGVGFRYTIQDHATDMHINGIARNLPNGQVELIAQGSKEELTGLLEAIKAHPGSAHIEKVKTNFTSCTTPISGFRIH